MADRLANHEAQRRMHSQQNRWLTVWVGALLALLALDALLLAFGSTSSGPSAQLAMSEPTREVLGIVLGVAAVASAIVALVLSLRDTASRVATRGQTRRDVRSLRRQVGGKQPTAPAQLPMARRFARSLASRSYTLLLPLTFGLIALAQGIRIGPDSFDRSLALFYELPLAIFVFTTIAMARQTRAARRFLDEHPDSAAPEPVNGRPHSS